MGTPAAVLGDRIMATCAGHQVPTPSGAPSPAPPMPFSAPVTTGCATSVLIAGKPAVVVGAAGTNTPPHVGLHPSDPHMAPPTQRGTVTTGSATVMVEGKPAAPTNSQAAVCLGQPGQVVGTASTVLIG